MLNSILNLLQGKKTILAAVLTILIVALKVFGFIDQAIFEAAVIFLGACGLWALRLAIMGK